MVMDQEIRQFCRLDGICLVVLIALQKEKSFFSRIWLDICTAVALLIEVAIGCLPLLKFVIGKHSAMHIEMDHMVVANAMVGRGLAQVMIKGFVGARAKNI